MLCRLQALPVNAIITPIRTKKAFLAFSNQNFFFFPTLFLQFLNIPFKFTEIFVKPQRKTVSPIGYVAVYVKMLFVKIC